MTGSGRYLAAFTEHFPSRSYYDPPDWKEREDLDYASDYPSEVAAIVAATLGEYDGYYTCTSLSAEIIDTETDQRWGSVEEFLRDT